MHTMASKGRMLRGDIEEISSDCSRGREDFKEEGQTTFS